MSKKERVLVAMSGGIDSTVTAMLLHEQGYEVVGITMKTWDYANSGGNKKETGCCSLDSINDAREVAVEMGFHHFIIDIRDEFGDYVIDNFVEEYMAGRTPNPCVLCNTHIKWSALLKRADAMDCAFIATGHYAQKMQDESGRYYISQAEDAKKDQSYVLWGLDQECLKRSIFPLGPYQKSEVRQMAFDRGHEELSKKGESFEICFVPDNDYRGFLKRRNPEMVNELDGGKYLDKDGNLLGYHKGYPFYTIGQRKGLGIALGEPMFVTKLDPENNVVYLGKMEELYKNGMYVYKTNAMKLDTLPMNSPLRIMVRYNDGGFMGEIVSEENGIYRIDFHANVKGIAPGQSAVFFDGDDLVGGGIIYGSEMPVMA